MSKSNSGDKMVKIAKFKNLGNIHLIHHQKPNRKMIKSSMSPLNTLIFIMISSSLFIAFTMPTQIQAIPMASALHSSAPSGPAIVVSGSSEIIPPPNQPQQQSSSTTNHLNMNPSQFSISSQIIVGQANTVGTMTAVTNSPKSSSSHHNPQQQLQTLSNPTKLPNINIYIEKSEIRKLLGE